MKIFTALFSIVLATGFIRINAQNNSDWSPTQNFITLPARLENEEDVSSFDAYPNPFSSATTISFSLNKNSYITMELFNLAERKIKTLLDENLNAGSHELPLNRDQLSAGIYFLQWKMNGETSTMKVIVQ